MAAAMIRTPYRYNTLTRWAITIPTLITGCCTFAWLGSAYQIRGVLASVVTGGVIGFLLGAILWRRR